MISDLRFADDSSRCTILERIAQDEHTAYWSQADLASLVARAKRKVARELAGPGLAHVTSAQKMRRALFMETHFEEALRITGKRINRQERKRYDNALAHYAVDLAFQERIGY